jgi:hypothetical protein
VTPASLYQAANTSLSGLEQWLAYEYSPAAQAQETADMHNLVGGLQNVPSDPGAPVGNYGALQDS